MSELLPYMTNVMPDATVSLFQYGFMGFWQARWLNKSVAHDLARMSKLEDDTKREVWITHSNGAAIAYLAVEEYDARPDMIININPALDRDITAGVRSVETIYSEDDRAVYFSQWIPFHIWGDQGQVGYKGRLYNTLSHDASKFGSDMSYKHHCGSFMPDRIEKWAKFYAMRIDEVCGRI